LTSNIVAITGGTGFIGSVITKKLLAQGYNVRSLVRPHHKIRSEHPKLHLVLGSLEDITSLSELVKDASTIIHCAGAVRGLRKADFFRTNVDGLKNIVHAIQTNSPNANLVQLSSLAAREPQHSYYSASKKAGETLLSSISNVTWTIFRPPAVYGPGDKEILPLLQIAKNGFAPVFGSRQARFSLLYAEDLANAVVNAINDEHYANKIFELDDGMPGGYSWVTISAIISDVYGKKVLQVPIPKTLLQILAVSNMLISRLTKHNPMLTLGKVRELTHPNWVCDTKIIWSDTNWRPQVTLQKGLLEVFK
jgi:nucleoside-diphosphate-sugar epimerase